MNRVSKGGYIRSLPRSSIRVLIVDDEADGRNLIARILSDRGAETVSAQDSAEAFRLLTTERFDVLLSDIGMPDMDGYELMRRIRAHESDNKHGRWRRLQ